MPLLICNVKVPVQVRDSCHFQISRNRSNPSFLTAAALEAGGLSFSEVCFFPRCEYRCQLPAEGLAGAMSGSACLSRALAGWSELGGAGGSMGDASKVLELFTFSAVSKTLLMFCLACSDVLFLCDRLWSLSLPPSLCVNPFSPTSVLSWIVSPAQNLAYFRGLMENL